MKTIIIGSGVTNYNNPITKIGNNTIHVVSQDDPESFMGVYEKNLVFVVVGFVSEDILGLMMSHGPKKIIFI